MRTNVLDERFPMDVTEPRVERAGGSSTRLTTLRTLRPSPIHLPNLLTQRAMGDRLQAVCQWSGGHRGP
ncbi:hypothetical protein J4Q44_G00350760 [Coregonus suidteri]|uniref:Uncharacterized protein n=1 Tax=Coregonus suidteri TaxID=861788 RepID=A0AAN8QC23_9TELE